VVITAINASLRALEAGAHYHKTILRPEAMFTDDLCHALVLAGHDRVVVREIE
jgi:hypothetical protein